jgi:hypothetical protein
MEIKLEVLLVIAVLFVLAIALSFIAGHNSRNKEVQSARDRVTRLFEHVKNKTGGTVLVEGASSYNLKSFDSGENWYAIKYNKEWGMKILGTAEDIHPGLLKHLDAMDKITSRIDNGEKFTLEDGINGKDANLFRDVGFKISPN